MVPLPKKPDEDAQMVDKEKDEKGKDNKGKGKDGQVNEDGKKAGGTKDGGKEAEKKKRVTSFGELFVSSMCVIKSAVSSKDHRMVGRVLRNITSLRKKMNKTVGARLIDRVLSASPWIPPPPPQAATAAEGGAAPGKPGAPVPAVAASTGGKNATAAAGGQAAGTTQQPLNPHFLLAYFDIKWMEHDDQAPPIVVASQSEEEREKELDRTRKQKEKEKEEKKAAAEKAGDKEKDKKPKDAKDASGSAGDKKSEKKSEQKSGGTADSSTAAGAEGAKGAAVATDPKNIVLLLPKDLYSSCHPEIEVFSCIIVLCMLIDSKRYDEALKCANEVMAKLKAYNRRSLDPLAARAWFYVARAYELKHCLVNVRDELMAAYRTASLHHDIVGQATHLCLLLRNYLQYSLYDLAMKLVSKTSFPENLRSNALQARYLYYLGKIKAVQLEYSDAHSKLMQAIRKAPQGKTALGFRLAAYKVAIVVELLMGDIPDRQIFNQKQFKEGLMPYRSIVQAVRLGDLAAFKATMEKYEKGLEEDDTFFLVGRLHHRVIRAGLRMVNYSYSRISIGDVCAKLGLDSTSDAEGIIAKSIYDGVLEATIDHDNMYIQSKAQNDMYGTAEPMRAFHKRIAFCLQLHTEAVKAMQYPDERNDSRVKEAEIHRQRRQDILAKAEEDDDGGDDFDML